MLRVDYEPNDDVPHLLDYNTDEEDEPNSLHPKDISEPKRVANFKISENKREKTTTSSHQEKISRCCDCRGKDGNNKCIKMCPCKKMVKDVSHVFQWRKEIVTI